MTSTSAAASLMVPEAPADAPLPPAGNVLAVTARPGPGVGGPGRAAVCLPPHRRQPGAAVPDPRRGVPAELDLRAA